jgi:hypothetical protein
VGGAGTAGVSDFGGMEVVARARIFSVGVDAWEGGLKSGALWTGADGLTSGALGAGVVCLMGGGVAFDLIFSPCVVTGAGSALVTTGDGGVAGLGIGSTTRGVELGMGREGIEGGCEDSNLEGCGRSAC